MQINISTATILRTWRSSLSARLTSSHFLLRCKKMMWISDSSSNDASSRCPVVDYFPQSYTERFTPDSIHVYV